jgi:cytochrome P450
MTDYLAQLDAAPVEARWQMARGWLYGEPLPFFAQLRAERPVLVTPEVTLATRFADCDMILRRHETFGVDLYKPKQGGYWMAQDDTAQHWREKSIMRAILDREEIPAMRDFIAKKAAELLAGGKGSLEVVAGLTRAAPTALTQEWFGFGAANPKDLIAWSYWNQQDAFHNQPFDHQPNADDIVRHRELSDLALAAFLAAVVAERAIEVKLGSDRNDAVTKLLKLSFSGGVKFDIPAVISNVGGLLIGAVETTSLCAVKAMEVLFSRPDVLAKATAAAAGGDTAAFDGFVFEALRFSPAFPYFFRTCHAPTVLAQATPFATEVPVGTTVLAVTHSAMFDETMFADPDRFDPTRSTENEFTFGAGLHECLGRAIGAVMIPEIVRQCLLLPGVKPAGPAEYETGVPERYTLTWTA